MPQMMPAATCYISSYLSMHVCVCVCIYLLLACFYTIGPVIWLPSQLATNATSKVPLCQRMYVCACDCNHISNAISASKINARRITNVATATRRATMPMIQSEKVICKHEQRFCSMSVECCCFSICLQAKIVRLTHATCGGTTCTCS